MRKAQMRQVLDFIESLHQAHEEIESAMGRKNLILAQNMLGECQQFAISFGENIEKLEGEGHITVSYVEDYCEVLFRVYEDVCNGHANEPQIHKILEEQLSRIEKSVQNDIKVKKEIAFFPYKASMWDSLESVYLAAREDPECDAFVVPIPYYDLNPDRSFGQMHYEGREYPKNIEVMDWQSYHFEKRKPDAIYIHNPYDSWNLVTSIPPRFYAEKLKKYTEKLIYIPYFVLSEIEPEDQARIDKMKHFCFIPGTVWADKVIVQSEKMKQIYVNEYSKGAMAAGLSGRHVDRDLLNQKILGLGSPKLEKIAGSLDAEIPDDWQSKMVTKDNERKKVIFFNTNVSLMLNNQERFIDNLRRIACIMESYRERFTVIWREHPLTNEALKSMHPDLQCDYLAFKSEFCSKEWVILDTLAEAHTAMAVSDGYFGAGGSLAAMYFVTGRPMMVTDYHYPNEISLKPTTLEKLKLSMRHRTYYNEKNINSLNLFLENIEDLKVYQRQRFHDSLMADGLGKGAGRKIYRVLSD